MPEIKMNTLYDTNYNQLVEQWGVPQFNFPVEEKIEQVPKISQNEPTPPKEEKKKEHKENFFDKIMGTIFPSLKPKKKGNQEEGKENTTNTEDNQKQDKEKTKNNVKNSLSDHPWNQAKNKGLKEKVKEILLVPDKDFDEKKLTSDIRRYIKEVDKHYNSIIDDYKSHIAPSYWEFQGNNYNVSGIFGKTYYVQSYPSYIESLWTRDIMSFYAKWDMSFFIYPEDDAAMQGVLKTKATQLKAEINEALQKGITLDTEVEQQYKDVEMIRQKLTTREERYFETGYYLNLYNEEKDKLKEDGRKLEQKLSGFGIRVKNAIQRMDEGFTSALPLCYDDLAISRSAITSSLAGSFPFISNDMVTNTWILYGINSYTGGLVLFDRFNSQLPNMNSCILATSGAGKSFTVKLEILRYLINGIDAIVIDPENEYKELCQKVGGTYINIATNSQQYLNPFDIPPKIEDVEYGKWDLLRSQIMNLLGLIQLMIGEVSPQEEAILDKALQNTYILKGFTFEDDDYEGKPFPLMEDLLNVLEGMTGAEDIAIKLSKYVTGTFGKIFNNYTNVDINNPLTVFSIRDLEDSLKTSGMFNVLNYIWTKVRSHKKQRLLVCDEAWIMLKHKISAEFLFGLIKRARKYWVGITTISQDIEDFVKSEYGKPIISNSSMQILLKQSPTSIKQLNDLLGLSEMEQRSLVSAWVGEGLIFAGPQHIGVKILASPEEQSFISTDI